jgi:hypothetical protein
VAHGLSLPGGQRPNEDWSTHSSVAAAQTEPQEPGRLRAGPLGSSGGSMTTSMLRGAPGVSKSQSLYDAVGDAGAPSGLKPCGAAFLRDSSLHKQRLPSINSQQTINEMSHENSGEPKDALLGSSNSPAVQSDGPSRTPTPGPVPFVEV